MLWTSARRHHGRTVVVVLHQGLGDTLMGVPMLRAIDDTLGPGDRLIVVTKSALEAGALRVFRWTTPIDVRIAPARTRRAYPAQFLAALSLRAVRPDLLIAPYLIDRARNAIWIRLIGARRSVGPDGRWLRRVFSANVRVVRGQHKVHLLAQFASEAGLPLASDPDVTVELPHDQVARARETMAWTADQEWIAFGPGSGEVERHKRWPATSYAVLADMLLARGPATRIAIFGSPGERTLLEEITRASSAPHRIRIFSDQTVDQSLALIAQCRVMVCGCSGLAHLAAAADVPIVGLFGPTNPGFTGPWSRRLHVVRLGLPCSPCYRPSLPSGCGSPLCMTELTPGMVMAEVTRCLAGGAPEAVPWTDTTDAVTPASASVGHHGQLPTMTAIRAR